MRTEQWCSSLPKMGPWDGWKWVPVQAASCLLSSMSPFWPKDSKIWWPQSLSHAEKTRQTKDQDTPVFQTTAHLYPMRIGDRKPKIQGWPSMGTNDCLQERGREVSPVGRMLSIRNVIWLASLRSLWSSTWKNLLIYMSGPKNLKCWLLSGNSFNVGWEGAF